MKNGKNLLTANLLRKQIFSSCTLRLCGLIFLLLFLNAPIHAQENAPITRLATFYIDDWVYGVSPDGSLMITFDYTARKIRVIEIPSGNVRFEIDTPYSVLDSVKKISNDAHFMIIGVNNGAEEWEQLVNLQTGEMGEVSGSIEFSADTSIIAARSNGTRWIQVIDTATGEILIDLRTWGGISPDGRFVILSNPRSRYFDIVEIETGKMLQQIRAFYIGFSPDGKWLTVARNESLPSTISVLEVGTWLEKATYRSDYNEFSPDGLLLLNRLNGTTQLLDPGSGEIIFQTDELAYFTSNGHDLLINKEVDTSQIVDPMTEQVRLEFTGGYPMFSPDGSLLMVIDYEHKTSKLINIATGEIQAEVAGYRYEFSPDGRWLAFNAEGAYRDIPMRLLVETATGNVVAAGNGIAFAPNGLVFVSNGQMVDVYGAPDTKLENFPPPFSDSGIVRMPTDITAYNATDADTEIIAIIPAGSMGIVLWRDSTLNWLRVLYYPQGIYQPGQLVWIQEEGLEIVESWEDAIVMQGAG